jgi:hypothetical protein
MIGNAVPVAFARHLAAKIKEDLKDFLNGAYGKKAKGQVYQGKREQINTKTLLGAI